MHRVRETMSMRSRDDDSSSSCSSDGAENDVLVLNGPLHEHLSMNPTAKNSLMRFTRLHAASTSIMEGLQPAVADGDASSSCSTVDGIAESAACHDHDNDNDKPLHERSHPASVSLEELLEDRQSAAIGHCPQRRQRGRVKRRASCSCHLDTKRTRTRRPQHHHAKRHHRHHRKQKLSSTIVVTTSILSLLGLGLLNINNHNQYALASTTTGGGYLTHPPSRNYLAYLHNTLLPSPSNPLLGLPETEPTPHNLNAGKMCGTVDGAERDYNAPMSRVNKLLPLNVQGIYDAGGEITVDIEMFGVDGGGHFEFSACPVNYPEEPSEECFERYPLEFVRDLYYGATKDEAFPNRAYIPYSNAFEENGLEAEESGEIGPGEATMMEFSYTFQLPRWGAEELNTDLNELERGGVPNGDVEGSTFTKVTTTTTPAQAKARARSNGNDDEDGSGSTTTTTTTGINNNIDARAHKKKHNHDHDHRSLQWIATQSNSVTVPSDIETVLISSLSTDGNGTTTIITLNGVVTVIEGGPKVPASSTLSYGSKAIYGKGIDVESLPEEVDPPQNGSIGQGSAPDIGTRAEPKAVPSVSAAQTFASGGGSRPSHSKGSDSSESGKDNGSSPVAISGKLDTAPSTDNPPPDDTMMIPTSTNSIINSNPNQKYVLLRWHYITALDCFPPGYDEYDWPTDLWGEWPRPWGGQCRDGFGNYRQEYWNCAEILVISPNTATTAVDDSGSSSSSDSDGDGDEQVPEEPEAALASDPLEDPTEPPTYAPSEPPMFAPSDPPIERPEPQSKPAVDDEAVDQDEIFAKDDRAHTTGTASVKIDVLANDVGDSLFVAAIRDGRHGACTLSKDNTVKYRSDMGFQGNDRCAYTACARGSDKEVCDEGWIYIKVFPSTVHASSAASSFANGSVDSEPESSSEDSTLIPLTDIGSISAEDDGVVTGLNQPIRVNVAENDNYTAGEGVIATVTEITSSAFHGTCQVVANKNSFTNKNWLDKEVQYTPNPDFKGWDHCTYKICLWYSGLGNDSVCDEAKVKIKVLDYEITNDPTPMPTSMPTVTPKKEMSNKVENLDPIANRDTITVIEGTAAFIDVLANDSDLDGDELYIDSWTEPEYGGRVDKVDDVLRYLPENGFTGRDSFIVTICDPYSSCDTSRVDIKVISEVFAMDDEARTTAGSDPIVIHVTANDYTSSKVNPLVLTNVNSAKYGKCELTGNNRVKYTPLNSLAMETWDRCAYIVCSGNECDKGRIEIRVSPNQVLVNTRPTRPMAGQEQTEDDTAEEMVQSTEPTAQTTETMETEPTDEPEPFDLEPETMEQILSTTSEPTAQTTETMETEPTDEPEPFDLEPETMEQIQSTTSEPTAVQTTDPMSEKFDDGDEDDEEEESGPEKVYAEDEIVTTPTNTPIIVDVAANDFIKGMGPLTVTIAGGAENGSCKVTSDNQMRYKPSKDFVGTDYCTYILCQDSNIMMCDEGLVKIKVIDQKTGAKPFQKQQESSSGGELVSNYESSGGLSLTANQRVRPSTAINCRDNEDGKRNLLRGSNGKSIRIPDNSACIGSSLVTTTTTVGDISSLRDDRVITYTSTYHEKKERSSLSSSLVNSLNPVLRIGRTASSSRIADNKNESAYIETVITISASADAVIMPGFPEKCFGKVPSILVSGGLSSGGVHETVVRFDTAQVDSTFCGDRQILSAKIFLYSLVHSFQGGRFITTSEKSWIENEVTWNNAPKSDGIVLMDLDHSIEARKWYGVDVSSALILGEALSIRIVSAEDEEGDIMKSGLAQYASRDHPDASLRPMLNVTCVSMDEVDTDNVGQ